MQLLSMNLVALLSFELHHAQQTHKTFWKSSSLYSRSSMRLDSKARKDLTLCECDQAMVWVQDPLAIIGIASILLPFFILGLAIATGFVDLGKTRMR